MNRIAHRLTFALFALFAFLSACSDGPERYYITTERIYLPADTDAGEARDAMGWNSSDLPETRDAAGKPKPKDGWQQTADLITGDTVKTGSMQADFPHAGYYTVQMGIQPPDQTLTPTAWDCVADVFWTVEGSTLQRTVSVGNGVSISGPGQAVKVIVRDRSDPTISTFGIPYKVFIQVTPGTRPSEERPPTLLAFTKLQVVPPLTALAVNVPPNAGVISVEVSLGRSPAAANPPPQQDLFTQQSAGLAPIKQYDPARIHGFVPLAPNVTRVNYFNNDAALNQTVQITWGIDG